MRKLFILILVIACWVKANAQCDNTHRPIVFIHGFLASGDTYATTIQRFIESGYCGSHLFVFDWNSINGNGKKTEASLKEFINAVLEKTKATQVDLVGHSAGGGLGRGYLLDSVDAQKVAHYAHLGSRKWFYEYGWFPNKKCLNIFSAGDMVMNKFQGDVDGATNLDLKDKDHYEVATSVETFTALYNFFNDGKEAKRRHIKGTASEIKGKAVLLGTNEPMIGARVEVFPLVYGHRRKKEATHIFLTDSAGSWGPFLADTSFFYEIALTSADTGSRKLSYYFEKFEQFNHNVYLRGFPKGNMVAAMLGNLPAKDDQSVIIIYSANKAIVHGRDTLAINDQPLSSAVLTPAARTIISSFIFDDGDGVTSGKPLKQFAAAPFLGGVDVSLPAVTYSTHALYFNGRSLLLPTTSSAERIMLAVFK
jgi:Lipase (class 2)/Lipase C-terminal domain